MSNASVVTDTGERQVEARPITAKAYSAAISAQMLEVNGQRVLRKRTLEGVGPLDEGDGAVGHLQQHAKLLIIHAAQPIGVDVADGQPPLVALGHGERRAGHRLLDAQRARCGPDEGRLADADLSAEQDDVVGAQERRDGPRQLPRLICRAGL